MAAKPTPNISKAEYDYIMEAYEKKDTSFKPDVRTIAKVYNQIMPDGVHVFHPISEQMCACSIRPYLIQAYRKLLTMKKPRK